MYSFNYLSTYLISYLLFVHQVCLVHFCWWVLVNFLNLHCNKSGQSWPCPLLLVGLSYFFSLPVATILDGPWWKILTKFCSVDLLIWFFISGSLFQYLLQHLIQPLICWVVDLFIKHLLFALSVDLLIQIFSYQFVDW